jgi:hypothetical protein
MKLLHVYSLLSMLFNTSVSCLNHVASDRWMNGYGALVQWYLWENWSTGRKVCPTATFYTTNSTLTGVGLKPGLHCENAVTNCVNHSIAIHFHNAVLKVTVWKWCLY